MDSPENITETILIVEDHEISALVATKHLQKTGFNVLHASHGEQALTILKTGITPDLILLDTMMPVMNGYEFLQHINSSPAWNNIPVIMLTALADSKDVIKALKHGARDYCIKPLDMNDIVKTIKRHIQ